MSGGFGGELCGLSEGGSAIEEDVISGSGGFIFSAGETVVDFTPPWLCNAFLAGLVLVAVTFPLTVSFFPTCLIVSGVIGVETFCFFGNELRNVFF